jgi:hypothetical protein
MAELTAERKAQIESQAFMVASSLVRLQGWGAFDALMRGFREFTVAHVGARGAYYRAQAEADHLAELTFETEKR